MKDAPFPLASAQAHTEYTHRLHTRQTVVERLTTYDRRTGMARLGVFLVGAFIAWFICRPGLLSWWWLIGPALLFVGLVVAHEQLRRRLRLAERSVAFYDRGLARLEDRWAGSGETGRDFLEEGHPYAADLDLFGPGSVFELLCIARTRGGEHTLATWLQTPAQPQEIQARQAAVEELRPKLDLREELVLHGADVRADIDPDLFAKIAGQGNEERSAGLAYLSQARALAAALAAGSVVCLLGWQLA